MDSLSALLAERRMLAASLNIIVDEDIFSLEELLRDVQRMREQSSGLITGAAISGLTTDAATCGQTKSTAQAEDEHADRLMQAAREAERAFGLQAQKSRPQDVLRVEVLLPAIVRAISTSLHGSQSLSLGRIFAHFM